MKFGATFSFVLHSSIGFGGLAWPLLDRRALTRRNDVKNLRLLCVAVLVAVVLVGVPSFVQANTLTFPITWLPAGQATDWSETASVSQFPPGSGTLLSVGLSLSGTLNSNITVQNITTLLGLGNNPSSGTASTQSALTVQDPHGNLTSSQLGLAATFPFSSLSAPTPISSGLLSSSGSDSNTYTSSPVLTDFTGNGTITLTGSTSTTTGIVYSGGVTYASASPTATLTGVVTYTFTAVPEPSTLALLCGGGVALIGYRWRKRRAA